MLLERKQLDPVDAVHRVVALQAQMPSSAYLALWNRLEGFDPGELDAAFGGHSLVKATLMRITLHVVCRDDYPAFHTAMVSSLRAARLFDRRFKRTGLTITQVDELLPRLVEFAAEPRTAAECEAVLDEWAGVLPKPGLWWALRTFAPLVHVATGPPWSFGARPSYVAAPERPSSASPDQCVLRLVWRYLEGFGPASAEDIAQFSLLKRKVTRQALAALAHELEEFAGPNGTTLYDVPGSPLPGEDAPASPRLMAMWDSVLLAYFDRSRVIPPDYRRLVTRSNGDVLPTLLVDGYVAGVWRAVDGGIEAMAFDDLPEEAWAGLTKEARALVAFLAEREPEVYSRHRHWWDKLPGGDIRTLAG